MHNCFRFRFVDVRCAGASGGGASRKVRVFAHIVLQISVQPHAVRAVSTGHDVENAFATRPTVACHTRGMPRTGMSTEVDADQVARASLFTPFVMDGA